MSAHRQSVAEAIEWALRHSSDVWDVTVEGDRVTFIMDGLACSVVVASALPVAPPDAPFAHGCPFCGSQRPPYLEKESSGPGTRFIPRRGCTDCNRWWDPVRIAKDVMP